MVLFGDTRLNLMAYFFATSLILYLTPEGILPSLKRINAAPTINAPVGYIGGTLMKSFSNRNIHAYKGIPYAEPPIGNLRFKKTQKLRKNAWKGVFDGRNRPAKCTQPTSISWFPVSGSEDCLYLNIYVPEVDHGGEGLPVMVWYHGGGFVTGESSDTMYGPGALLDKDVILVTVNYRLGIFGFLTLGTEEIPGNQGMWDQLEALRWVNENIAAFGGNHEKITIFGESAGGWSISSLLASHQTKGLYRGAVVQSGPLEFPGLKIDQYK